MVSYAQEEIAPTVLNCYSEIKPLCTVVPNLWNLHIYLHGILFK